MAPKIKPKWDIPTRSRVCCKGQEVLQPDTVYYSLLSSDDSGIYQRKDYCPSCWQAELAEREVSSTYWKATVPKRKDKKLNSQEMGDGALQLLHKALSDHEPQSKEEAFVLGLYLHRIKMLAPRQEMQIEGEECTLYEVLETSEMLCVPKVPLSAIEISNLQMRISSKLNDLELS